jgi:hypothetical protein
MLLSSQTTILNEKQQEQLHRPCAIEPAISVYLTDKNNVSGVETIFTIIVKELFHSGIYNPK